ncbi:MAG: DNA alkylation repair protein [Bacillota bacterium]|jgi:3-methyladenine DNA glycosylase AlkD
MKYQQLFQQLAQKRDPVKSKPMSAHMQNKFSFLGVSTPERKRICRPFFSLAKANREEIDWEFVKLCWQKPEREYQYVAINYLSVMQEHLTAADLPKLKELLVEKSWWDTIDGLVRLVGGIAAAYPEVKEELLAWSLDDNSWLRRAAIDHQLNRKKDTDTELLEQIIVNNLDQRDFFINKAIGWSLREYSKVDPQWVRKFIRRYHEKMSKLSIIEGSKYL